MKFLKASKKTEERNKLSYFRWSRPHRPQRGGGYSSRGSSHNTAEEEVATSRDRPPTPATKHEQGGQRTMPLLYRKLQKENYCADLT